MDIALCTRMLTAARKKKKLKGSNLEECPHIMYIKISDKSYILKNSNLFYFYFLNMCSSFTAYMPQSFLFKLAAEGCYLAS